VRAETDDEGAVTFCAEPALVAGDSRDPLGRADHHLVSCRRSEAIGTVLRNDSRDGKAGLGERIGMGDGVRRKVHDKSVAISGTDRFKVRPVYWFVRIRKTAPAIVRFGKLRQRGAIDFVAVTGQITGLVVPPQLAGGK